MKLLKLIKEFIEWRDSIRHHTIDITPDMKKKLEAYDEKTIKAIYGNTLDVLSREMLRGELSADYVSGAKFALIHFKKHFKK